MELELEGLKRFAVALAIGGLIGLERERSKRFSDSNDDGAGANTGSGKPLPATVRPARPEPSRRGPPEPVQGEPVQGQDVPSPEFAGIRTFSLIALCGALSAYLAQSFGNALFIAAFSAFTLLATVAYHQVSTQGFNLGITTAVSALLVFALSGLCMVGPLELCGAIGITVYLILAFKPSLRALARAASPADLEAIGKFGAITLLVLPLLPDRTYGPFDVLNPRKIWLMVVLIAAVSLAGYIAVKAVGPRRGFGLTGLLGGLASSTATTLSFARRSREVPELALECALAIVLACTVMVLRLFGIVALLNAALISMLWIPLAGMLVVALGASVILYARTSKSKSGEHDVALTNPFELGPALKFAVVFTIILFGSSALQHYLGNAGLYVSGVVAGLTDVDAIVLSMARGSAASQIEAGPAVTAIVLATISNTLTKAFLALGLAGPVTRKWVFGALLAQAIVGGALALILHLA